MPRVVLTSILLVLVLIQASFGCFARHSHASITPRSQPGGDSVAHHSHEKHTHGDHQRYGHQHPAPLVANHFHAGGEPGDEHRHDSSCDDTFHFVLSRSVEAPSLDVVWLGHAADLIESGRAAFPPRDPYERIDAHGRSARPMAQRLCLCGAWLI